MLFRSIAKYNIKTVIEIGSFLGYSSAWFARRVEKVYCIDTWKESGIFPNNNNLVAILPKLGVPTDFYDVWRRNMKAEGVFDKIVPLRGPSLLMASSAPVVDLVYIDGDHSKTGAFADISHYLPKARKVICGDDYTPDHPGVKWAATELLPSHEHDGPFWWYEMDPAIGDGCDVQAVRREAAQVVGV